MTSFLGHNGSLPSENTIQAFYLIQRTQQHPHNVTLKLPENTKNRFNSIKSTMKYTHTGGKNPPQTISTIKNIQDYLIKNTLGKTFGTYLYLYYIA